MVESSHQQLREVPIKQLGNQDYWQDVANLVGGQAEQLAVQVRREGWPFRLTWMKGFIWPLASLSGGEFRRFLTNPLSVYTRLISCPVVDPQQFRFFVGPSARLAGLFGDKKLADPALPNRCMTASDHDLARSLVARGEFEALLALLPPRAWLGLQTSSMTLSETRTYPAGVGFLVLQLGQHQEPARMAALLDGLVSLLQAMVAIGAIEAGDPDQQPWV